MFFMWAPFPAHSHQVNFGSHSVQAYAGLDKAGDSQFILFLFAKRDITEHLPYIQWECIQRSMQCNYTALYC